MRVNGQDYRTVWMEGMTVRMLDQNRLPFEVAVVECTSARETAGAIRDMTVRGAPAIGAAAAFAMAQGFAEGNPAGARAVIEGSRPTARDLFDGVERVWNAAVGAGDPAAAALRAAGDFAEEGVAASRRIGSHGASLITEGMRVMTHCNAGWLATVDFGTALAPVFVAAEQGRPAHVWACETRPRGQGGRLTAWELTMAGIPHAIVADTAAASLMSRGLVDLVIVGADRITANGDVVNKVGTLERAICAREYGIPFYTAAPPSTFDSGTARGADVVIEDRDPEEVHFQTGPDQDGIMRRIRVTNPGSAAVNPAFDVTPARLVTGYITEAGVLDCWPPLPEQTPPVP